MPFMEASQKNRSNKMNISKLQQILEIVNRYSTKGDINPFTGAATDVIFLNLTLDKVSEHDSDGQRLIKLGCVPDEYDVSWCIYI